MLHKMISFHYAFVQIIPWYSVSRIESLNRLVRLSIRKIAINMKESIKLNMSFCVVLDENSFNSKFLCSFKKMCKIGRIKK